MESSTVDSVESLRLDGAPTSIVLVMEVGIQTLAGHLLDLFQVAIPNELQKMFQVGLKHSDNHNEH